MLTAFRLGNFKAFGETQTIPLRPLTLIFGANSSGKSSIIHGLLFAHEANRTGNLDVQRTELGGDSVDLGGLRQFAHQPGTGPVEWAAEIDMTRPAGRFSERLASVRRLGVCSTVGFHEVPISGRPWPARFTAVASSLSYTVEADGTRLLRASRQGGQLRIEYIDQEHPVFQEALNLMLQFSAASTRRSPAHSPALGRVIKDLGRQLVLVNKLLPDGVLESVMIVPTKDEAESSPIQRKPKEASAAAAVRYLLPRAVAEVLRNVKDAVAAELGNLSYLGPFRSYLPRRFIFDQDQDANWLAGGGHAYEVARQNWKVRDAVNRCLGDTEKMSTPYELVAEHLWRGRDLKDHVLSEMASAVACATGEDGTFNYDEAEQGMLGMLGDLEAEVDQCWYLEGEKAHLQIMALRDKRTGTQVTHRDVGIGVSQVIPVLVHAFASTDRMIAIEQPEIHLHPALQAELADVFIESALGERKNMFILETHSLGNWERHREAATAAPLLPAP